MEINLPNGKVTQIDDADYSLVKEWSWHSGKNRYVEGCKPGTRKAYLHRIIMGAQKGQVVDHINHDVLDNRRSNLRLCSQSQNLANSRKWKKPCSSIYKGVSKRGNKWRAYIKFGKKIMCLGTHETELDAAHTYDFAALAFYGEYARLNIPFNQNPSGRSLFDSLLRSPGAI